MNMGHHSAGVNAMEDLLLETDEYGKTLNNK